MANIQALTAQGINVATSSPHATYREVCKIAAASFTPSATYLIIVSAFVRAASSANEALMRLSHNTTPFTDGTLAYELTSTTQKANLGWLYTYTQPGTPQDIILEVANASTSQTTVEWAGIVAINLDDLGTQGTDYFFNEVTSDYSTTSSYVDQAAVTLTANGTDDYLIIAQGVLSGVSTTTNHQMRINDSVAGALATIDVEGEDATNETRGYLMMTAVTPSAASHTFSAQFAHETNSVSVLSSRIFSVSLSKFAQHAISRDVAAQQPAASPSWTTTQTVAPTPSATGNWLLWGYLSDDVGTLTDDLNTRLQMNPDGSGLASDPNYGNNSPGQDGWDPTDITPVNIFRLRQLNSGASRTVNFDVQMAAGTTLRVTERTLIAIAMETPSGGGGDLVELEGTSSFTFTSAGALALYKRLVAASSLSFTTANTLLLSKQLLASSGIDFTTASALQLAKILSASSTFDFTPEAELALAKLLVGSSDLDFATDADLLLVKPLSGSSQLEFVTASDLIRRLTFGGSSSISFTTTAVLTLIKALEAGATLGFTPVSQLALFKPLGGGSALDFSTAAALTRYLLLSGASVLTFSTSASLAEAINGLIANGTLTFETSASLSVGKFIGGTSSLLMNTAAVLSLVKTLAASSSLEFASAAQLDLIKRLHSAVTLHFDGVGTLTKLIALTGNTTLDLNTAATVRLIKALEAETSLAMTGEAVLFVDPATRRLRVMFLQR